jgi:hypothetical protein
MTIVGIIALIVFFACLGTMGETPEQRIRRKQAEQESELEALSNIYKTDSELRDKTQHNNH